MALRSKQGYIDSIRGLQTELYAYGKQVPDLWEHPCFRPAMEAIGLVYELSEDDGDKGFFTAHSPFIDGKVNRFLHIHQTQEDLRNRFRLSRFLVHKHGACIGARCVGTGALNALFASTYDMDRQLGTDYHQSSACVHPARSGKRSGRLGRHDGCEGRPQSESPSSRPIPTSICISLKKDRTASS